MKNILCNFLLVGGLLLGISSCSSEYKLDDLLMQKYHKILYVKDSGVRSIMINTACADPEDSITIVKAGSHVSEKASAKIKALSISEMQSAFGDAAEGYTVIPADFYTFKKGTDVVIASDDRLNNFCVDFDVAKLRAAVKANPNLKLALPLQLYSDCDTINTKMDKMLLTINVITPTLSWTIEDYNPSMVYKSLNVKLGASISNYDENVSNFSCGFDDLDIESLVQSYNLSHGTSYDAMPKSCCQFTDFAFKKGDQSSNTTLVISRSGLTNDHTYLLPLKFKAGSDASQLDLSQDIQYLVVSNPKYGWVAADRSNWKIVFCNEDNKWGGATGADGAGAPAMIDNDKDSYWMYGSWNDYAWQFNGDDYDYSFKDYHAFFGDRWYGDGYNGQQVIVIDMQKQLNILGVGLIQRQDLKYCIQKCAFAVSTDDAFKFVPIKNGGNAADYNEVALNNWIPLLTWDNIPAQKSICWQKIDTNKNEFGIKGRFLKIMPLVGSPNSSHSHGSCIAEMMVMQIATVDGNPIN